MSMAKKKENTGKVTIDQLARMVQKGFLDVGRQFEGINQIHKTFASEFDRIRSDIRDIKITLGPLVHFMGMADAEMGDMKSRLSRVERKVGISKN